MSVPSSCAHLYRKGRKLAAVGVKDLCLKAAAASQTPSSSSDDREALSTVEDLLREILDPQKLISDQDNIDWIRHILAGGDAFEEFAAKLKVYDDAVTCGFVWTSNFGEENCSFFLLRE